MSRLSEFINENTEHILRGRVLAIDPSSGSKSSMPGYAIYSEGVLVESGTIEIPYGGPLAPRLQALLKSLQAEFKCPDVLAVEFIPPKINNKAIISLQRSIGVIMAAFPCLVVEVAAISWRTHKDAKYFKHGKGDELDAIYIGKCVVERAKVIANTRGLGPAAKSFK